jgi:hypothetical protein
MMETVEKARVDRRVGADLRERDLQEGVSHREQAEHRNRRKAEHREGVYHLCN